MEQYLGQFIGNFIASLQGEPLSSTLFSGFMMLAVFTFLAYLIFRIALIALKVGTIVGVLVLVASMGMPAGIPNGSLQATKGVKNSPNKDTQISMPDLSSYVSEEKLREIFLGYIKSFNK